MPDAAELLDALAAEHDAVVSVWMGGVDGVAWLARDAAHVHPAASTMKLPLLVALYRAVERAELRLDDEIEVRAVLDSVVADRTYETTQDYDNDEEPWGHLGRTATLGWLGSRAIVRSSNLATNLLIDILGLDAVNGVYDDVGAVGCRVRRGIQDLPGSEVGAGNEVDADGLSRVLAAVARHDIASPATCESIERVLAACEHRDGIAAGIPPRTYLANKTGWITDVCHDVALVRPEREEPFVLCVLSAAPLDEDAGHRLVAEVTRVCWEHRRRCAGQAAT
ncbi:MAG: class A beta-lactamase-related serine hydrolase [Actinomycetota bacterium]|nr:class A beta-lactamase-related serine hydrolase [Actinomycetota bacterium]